MRADNALRRTLRRARRRTSSSTGVWRRALPRELAFWSEWIRTGGSGAAGEFAQRLDPSAPILDPYLLAALDAVGDARPVRILDVGAGPLTTVGFKDPRAPERRIEVVAVDPLASDYRELLESAGVSPPVWTQPCRGEDVAEAFGEAAFDIAYARNSLDHAADPMAAIESMIRAVRPGGAVILIHGRREGEARGYEELHQWNFDAQAGRLILFGRGRSYDLAARLGETVRTSFEIFDAGEHGEWIAATLSKEPATPR